MTPPIYPTEKRIPLPMPAVRKPLIPVLRTHPDGTTQTYWISLEKFMEERNRGIKLQRIPRKDYMSVKVPDEPASEYEVEFIENIEDFGVAGLEFEKNKFEVELIAEVRIKKNGKLISTLPLKLNKEQIARAVLQRILGTK